ncbi:hypothetical protein Y032_0280g1233 [Ancylostoma ceylanicum]|uniref:Uncharacterized protein n=1 Tax=Ancylostoma ceylanicum TaxID=53326 RepID=A0A016S7R2_9BILA|nr:hypothetical protein Y032_0280g1233 [Ancylostoma ceylanicum]
MFQESSEERSLGEEEDMDLFIAKPKPKLKKAPAPSKTVSDGNVVNSLDRIFLWTLRILFQALDIGVASDDDGGFDVSELMNAVPPIADADEDFDDI